MKRHERGSVGVTFGYMALSVGIALLTWRVGESPYLLIPGIAVACSVFIFALVRELQRY